MPYISKLMHIGKGVLIALINSQTGSIQCLNFVKFWFNSIFYLKLVQQIQFKEKTSCSKCVFDHFWVGFWVVGWVPVDPHCTRKLVNPLLFRLTHYLYWQAQAFGLPRNPLLASVTHDNVVFYNTVKALAWHPWCNVAFLPRKSWDMLRFLKHQKRSENSNLQRT